MGTQELKLTDVLAVQRTQMASERTLMGWIRTAISMIGFGFTITKALQYAVEEGALKGIRAAAPENVGVTLIVLATVSLSFACIRHWYFVRRLPATGVGTRPWDLSLTLASLIITLGLLVMLNILFRVGPF